MKKEQKPCLSLEIRGWKEKMDPGTYKPGRMSFISFQNNCWGHLSASICKVAGERGFVKTRFSQTSLISSCELVADLVGKGETDNFRTLLFTKTLDDVSHGSIWETRSWHNALGYLWEVMQSAPRELPLMVHTRVEEHGFPHRLPRSCSMPSLVAQLMEETIPLLNSHSVPSRKGVQGHGGAGLIFNRIKTS